MIKTKWLIYTVMLGAIPFIIRFIVFLLYKGSSICYLFNEIDFIIFGLVLSLTNISALEHNTKVEEEWKSIKIGVSLLFIFCFSIFLFSAYLSETGKVEPIKILFKICTITVSGLAFLNSYSIINRINSIA